MNVKGYHKGRTIKTVVVENVSDTDTIEDVKCLALVYAGETWGRVFGVRANESAWTPGIVTVTIDTD